MNDFLVALTLITALGCALGAGALFAFSSFVMKALAKLPAPQGIAAMQSINVQAPTPVFMTALFGSGVASIAVGVWALADWHDWYSPYLVAGALLYVVGTCVVTMAYHVPRNNALAAVDPDSREGADAWRHYVREWTAGNHVRVAAGAVAVAAFMGALHAG